MSKTCTNVMHPQGTQFEYVRSGKKADYFNRICDVCGKVQGLARILRMKSA